MIWRRLGLGRLKVDGLTFVPSVPLLSKYLSLDFRSEGTRLTDEGVGGGGVAQVGIKKYSIFLEVGFRQFIA